ncbi:MAG: Asp-tRNA(Asn)/Glu-tRNA(Gln) amidotransferase subunit GatC [Gemmatimonadaceae bacterium]
MAIAPEDIRHLAALARLGVDDAQLPALVAELNGILGHMDVLAQVPLRDEEATAPDNGAMPLRDDLPSADPLHRERAAFAPAMRDGFFLVPRLATHGAAGASADEEDHSA